MDRFEKELRSRVELMSDNTDLTEVWQAIEEKRTRRRSLFLLSMLFVGFLTTFGIVFFFSEGMNSDFDSYTEGRPQSKLVNSESKEFTMQDSVARIDRKEEIAPVNIKETSRNPIDCNPIALKTSNKTKTSHYLSQSKKETLVNTRAENELKAALSEVSSHDNISLNYAASTDPNSTKNHIGLPSELQALSPQVHFRFERTILIDAVVPPKESQKPKRLFSLQINAGIPGSLLTASAITSESVKQLIDQRNQFEKTELSGSAKVGFTRYLSDNWYLETGLEYQQLNMCYKYYYSNVSTVLKQDTVAEIVTDGVSNYLYDEVAVLREENYKARRSLLFRSMRIPIIVGFDYTFSEDMSLKVSGGFNPSVLAFNRGVVFNDENSLNSQAKLTDSGYDLDFGLSGLTEIYLRRKLYDKLSFSLGIRLEQDVLNRVNSDFRYEHKFRSVTGLLRLDWLL